MDTNDTALLLKLAHRAVSDPALLAGVLDGAAQQARCDWAELARRLQVDEAALARLALCRRPKRSRFESDVQQLAAACGMEPRRLGQFLRQAPPAPAASAAPIAMPRPAARRSFSRLAWLTAGLLVVLALLTAFVFTAPQGSQATLVVQTGQALVQAGQPLGFIYRPAQITVAAGQALAVSAGDRITLPAGAVAQLRLIDGSSVDLLDQADVVVEELVTSENVYRFRMEQLGGKTINRVLRLLGVGDRFEIHTPSSTMAVRGTVFTVQVIDPSATLLSVEKGTVHFVTGDQSVMVHAGEQMLGRLADPAGQPPVAGTPLPTGSTPGVPGAPEVSPAPGGPAQPGEPTQPVNPNDVQPPAGGDPGSGANPGGGSTDPANGPPGSVPGSPPSDTKGEGDPPSGGGDPPGQGNNPNKRP